MSRRVLQFVRLSGNIFRTRGIRCNEHVVGVGAGAGQLEYDPNMPDSLPPSNKHLFLCDEVFIPSIAHTLKNGNVRVLHADHVQAGNKAYGAVVHQLALEDREDGDDELANSAEDGWSEVRYLRGAKRATTWRLGFGALAAQGLVVG